MNKSICVIDFSDKKHAVLSPYGITLGRLIISNQVYESRGGSRTAATSKMERFVIIADGSQPLTIIAKRSILDVAAVLDQPLESLRLRWIIRTFSHVKSIIQNFPHNPFGFTYAR